MTQRIPLVDYLVLDDGAPHLVAYESPDSGALYLERRNADPLSGTIGFRRRRLASTGTVRSFTVVYRDSPGIDVPYVSAIIDLDGGGVVRSNLLGVDPDPNEIARAMPVRLVTFVAGIDDQGTEAIAFGFEPRSDD